MILYLIQIYFLTKYLVESAENSISETQHFKFFGGSMPHTPLEARVFGARFCEYQLKNSIFLAPSLQITLRRPWCMNALYEHVGYTCVAVSKKYLLRCITWDSSCIWRRNDVTLFPKQLPYLVLYLGSWTLLTVRHPQNSPKIIKIDKESSISL